MVRTGRLLVLPNSVSLSSLILNTRNSPYRFRASNRSFILSLTVSSFSLRSLLFATKGPRPRARNNDSSLNVTEQRELSLFRAPCFGPFPEQEHDFIPLEYSQPGQTRPHPCSLIDCCQLSLWLFIPSVPQQRQPQSHHDWQN